MDKAVSPDEAPKGASPTPTQRSASTARRERRNRCSYLAGERAGMLAGLKEAERVVSRLAPYLEERPTQNAMVTYTVAVRPDADAAVRAISARIVEIEGSEK